MSHAVAYAVNLDLEHIDLRPDPNLPFPLVAWDMATHRFTGAGTGSRSTGVRDLPAGGV